MVVSLGMTLISLALFAIAWSIYEVARALENKQKEYHSG